jgi:NAD-dependent dihydropyrimidine dehydrogenase PreA subunit
MTTGNNLYEKLSEKIGVTGYPRYVKILEAQLTPEEARLIIDLAEGKPREQLLKELNIDDQTLSTRIEDLARKGCIQIRETGYTVPQSPRFFHRRGDTPELQKLWHEFFHSGDYPEIHVHHIKQRTSKTKQRSHKIIPARQALLASPNLKKEEILWYEDMEQIFRKAKARYQGGFKEDGTLAIRDGCGCRRFWGVCEAPGGCTGWEWEEGTWPGDETVHYEQARRRSPGPRFQRRAISVEEALAACDQMEDFGLVHISPNTGQITSTCNCCECDCEILHGMKYFGNVWEMLAPSRYRAVIDVEKCDGCQTCIERCHFDAIEMRKVPGSKKMKAFIIDEHCMGCGLCIYKCPNNAMRFELVRPPEYIPTIPMSVMFAGR